MSQLCGVFVLQHWTELCHSSRLWYSEELEKRRKLDFETRRCFTSHPTGFFCFKNTLADVTSIGHMTGCDLLPPSVGCSTWRWLLTQYWSWESSHEPKCEKDVGHDHRQGLWGKPLRDCAPIEVISGKVWVGVKAPGKGSQDCIAGGW